MLKKKCQDLLSLMVHLTLVLITSLGQVLSCQRYSALSPSSIMVRNVIVNMYDIYYHYSCFYCIEPYDIIISHIKWYCVIRYDYVKMYIIQIILNHLWITSSIMISYHIFVSLHMLLCLIYNIVSIYIVTILYIRHNSICNDKKI